MTYKNFRDIWDKKRKHCLMFPIFFLLTWRKYIFYADSGKRFSFCFVFPVIFSPSGQFVTSQFPPKFLPWQQRLNKLLYLQERCKVLKSISILVSIFVIFVIFNYFVKKPTFTCRFAAEQVAVDSAHRNMQLQCALRLGHNQTICIRKKYNLLIHFRF